MIYDFLQLSSGYNLWPFLCNQQQMMKMITCQALAKTRTYAIKLGGEIEGVKLLKIRGENEILGGNFPPLKMSRINTGV